VAVVSEAGALGRGTVLTRTGKALSSREVFDACPPRLAEFDRKPSFTF